MKLALLLVAINPRLKGVLLTGEKGTGKSTAARALSNLLDLPFVNLPLAATEEALLGGIDLSAALRGEKKSTRGLLAKAHRGVLYVDEINLLPPHLLLSLLNALDQGAFRLEREGLSGVFEADFVLLGSMNPEEGPLP
ncbi:MAG: AAA domain-containing protein, partial [Thermodesulfobacteria bacterium]|nr:AAA domain-containing protein [Thermodesulfobacteriota bacterium]